MRIKNLIGYPVTGVAALLIGIAIGSAGGGTTTADASHPAPTVTVTATAPGKTRTIVKKVPGPTVTVTAKAKPQPVKTLKVTVPPKPKAAIPGDGTYEVGKDVKPGTYVSSTPDSGNCYWARLSGTDGFDDIIANNNSSGQSLVTIKSSDKFFQTNGCNTWTLR